MANEHEPPNPGSDASPNETRRVRADSDANAGKVECVACRESIAAGTRICPFCKTRQHSLSLRAQAVRWTAAALTLATLVLGLREGVGLVAARIEKRTVTHRHLAAAANLLAAQEYRLAWDLTEEVAKIAPQSRRLQRDRLAIARAWLLDAHTLGNERGFLDIVDRVVPVLSTSAPSLPQRERAEALALLAFAQRLRERSEAVSLKVTRLYRKAIETDPACGLPHLLLGHDLALWSADLSDALPHLARAANRVAAGDLDPALFRRYQISALSANLYHPSEDTARLAAVELMRAVDDVRKRDEAPPIDPQRLYFHRSTLWNDLERIHREALMEPQATADLARALPAAEHLATLSWIRDNRPNQLRIDGIRIWIAMLLEQQNEIEAAAAALQSIPVDGVHYRLAPIVDQVHVRLTGRPHRPLEEIDPWGWRIKTLSAKQPGSPEFERAVRQVGEAAAGYHTGRQSYRDQLLAALKAADRSFQQNQDSDRILSEAALDTWRRLRFDLGVVLKDKNRLQDALAVLTSLAGELQPGHPLRGSVLVEKAAVHASLAASDRRQYDSQIRTGAALLVQAVETEGYLNWARLRWHSDLAPLHESADFKALLERHGRSPSTAMTKVPHAE